MMSFICPLCREPLCENPQGLHCGNHHQFDRAREGYFNLLPAHHKNSRQPGDSRQQLQARREFLAAGFFSPLASALQALIPGNTRRVLDIGCGEGYFTQHIAHALDAAAQVYGIDIAKEGVRLAAKRSQHVNPDPVTQANTMYAVASSYALPVADQSMDVITRIYAPSKDTELQRVMAPQGQLIIITPGQEHLLALRKKIYHHIRPHPEPEPPAGFTCVARQKLDFDLSLPAGSLTQALLHMTPFAWRLTQDSVADIVATGWIDRADFNLAVYRRIE